MKLKLAQKILCQEKSVARSIYEEQLSRDWPGLSTEVKNICEAIGIEDVNIKKVEKEAMEEAIFFHHYKEMKQALEKCSKLEGLGGLSRGQAVQETPGHRQEDAGGDSAIVCFI